MLNPLDLSLLTGPIPVTATAAAVLALARLAFRRERTWWTRALPIVVVACAALVLGAVHAIDHVWRPWPEPLPGVVVAWVGAALLAVGLTTARWRASRGRAVDVALVLVVLLGAGLGVNGHFGFYPTTRAVLEVLVNDRVDLAEAATPTTSVLEVPEGARLADVWRRPENLPERGTVSEAVIPGGFAARPAWIYLPPAYAASPRPRLPVVVLLAGQPGSPRDWFDAGRLTEHLDAFARAHDGLAPVVVVADQLGARTANPLCLDSRLGRSETYLAREVPAWVKQRLTVDERREAWTIAGASQGGTCALQLAVRAPEVYGSFVDLAGQREPTLGSRAETVEAAFGGDEAAFTRVNPLDVLARQRFPDTAGVLVVGREDSAYRQASADVLAACRAAGMDVRREERPGGHDWNVWRSGLRDSLPWLAARTGLVR
ncbi:MULTISPECIES: alpha/beta hydrolase-fold protein [Actinosynnema]|uniref:alpha/beta hydrolase n=1 Tax=Actinosynnema TaxID=40566 RepID=UPI0020A25F5A|nr:alpha/beta hydrolase-fold protein [Actinosynnema pretiosum]